MVLPEVERRIGEQLCAGKFDVMRFLKLFLKRETVAPMLAMAFATITSSIFVVALVLSAENLRAGIQRHGYLIWNLFLAWIPLIFALLACEELTSRTRRNWRFAGFAFGWLIFFPNAPYIFTDLVHISIETSRHYWIDLAMVLACALTGLMLWFVSLYLMHALMARRFGRLAGWGFVTLMAALTSFGIYMGRFQRFNSWDVMTKPGEVFQGIGSWASAAISYKPTVAFPLLFTIFLFLAYLMLYALTHLSPAMAQRES
jgi:uncharacterized membrane protein